MADSNPDEIDLSDASDFYTEEAPNTTANDYEVAEDPALAATLGFTSFGGQDDSSRPAKKRRFNPLSDNAVVASPRTAEPSLTAQRAQLRTKPKPSAAAAAAAASTEEINYSDDDGDTAAANPADDNADSNPDFELDLQELDEDDDEDAPHSTKSTPALTPSLTPSPPPPHGDPAAAQPTKSNSAPQGGHSTPLPARPVAGAGRDRARGGGAGGPGGGGGHNPLWYVDYYDASSNENPWEGMEKYKGLPSVGTWLPSYWATSAVAAAGDAGAGVGEAGAGAGGENVTTTAG